MNGAVRSRPLPEVKTWTGVRGCLSGTNVSYKAKMTRVPKPATSVPMTLGLVAGRMVV